MQYKYFHICKEWASSHFLFVKGIIEETEFLFPAKCDPFHRFNLGSGYSCFSHCTSSFLCFPSLSAFFFFFKSLTSSKTPLSPRALGASLPWVPAWCSFTKHLTTILSEGWQLQKVTFKEVLSICKSMHVIVETMHISITNCKQKLFYRSQVLQSPFANSVLTFQRELE